MTPPRYGPAVRSRSTPFSGNAERPRHFWPGRSFRRLSGLVLRYLRAHAAGVRAGRVLRHVGLRDDAYEPAVLLDHRQPAYLVLGHQLQRPVALPLWIGRVPERRRGLAA